MLKQGFLKQPDIQFWTDPVRNSDVVRDALAAANFQGVVLDGPRHLPFNMERWPVVACERCTESTGPEAQFDELATLVAVDPDTDQVWVGHAYTPRVPDDSLMPPDSLPEGWGAGAEPDEPSDVPEADPYEGDEGPENFDPDDLSPEELAALEDEDVPEGATEEPVLDVVYFLPHTLDLQEQLQLPQRLGRYVVFLLFLDKVSNPVRLSVGKPLDAYQDPAVEAFLASQRDALPPPEVLPSLGPGALYGEGAAQAGAPAPPASIGVVLQVDETTTRGEPLRVRGAFRLPAHAHLQTVRPGQPPIDVGVPGATAVVPLTLVFTGPVYGGPMTVSLQVPTSDSLEGDAPATGQFVVDVAATGRLHDVPAQTYHAHAFAGGLHRASVSFEVVEPGW